MSDKLIAWLREHCSDIRGDVAADRIEQLTARVRELEEENARLKSEVVNRNQRALDGDKAVKAADALYEQLAAEQLSNKRLREALSAALFTMEEIWREEIECLSSSDLREAKEALALPHDTSVLDAYVVQKIKEYN